MEESANSEIKYGKRERRDARRKMMTPTANSVRPSFGEMLVGKITQHDSKGYSLNGFANSVMTKTQKAILCYLNHD